MRGFSATRLFDAFLLAANAYLSFAVLRESLALSERARDSALRIQTSLEYRQSLPIVNADAQKYAYASLCFGDVTVDGTLVLFMALKAHNAQADFVALTHNLSRAAETRLARHGVRSISVEPLQTKKHYMTAKKKPQTDFRDAILWSKLRAWQLTDYSKVIMMDADLLVLENVDELFQMPQVAASAMVHPSEKISFFKTSEYGMRPRNKIDRKSRDSSVLEGWSGLNSGVTVLKPSNETFQNLLSELSIIPNRPCCPSQEFIYNFFEERKQYFRLPAVYNGRVISSAANGGDDEDTEDSNASSLALRQLTKIHHFVGAKPWKKRDVSSVMNRLWWEYMDKVTEIDKAK
ncbi:hypothetical protein CcCBS67573_g02308 [Chytriomyces confervae]|uniref:Hexosyltransferase n=1 Tax=Chytriomyces confervae TaxID=246404 RepID=A0A507FMA5_9FUNG|nr:hypothetical protein HDU80_009185 [Chytriomyces hyalinus]TPX76446.1 hypothetical protein CcCBS67573_g02308 [Chytriomyces confervae]